MQLQTTLRKQVKARYAFEGPTGSGKTLSSLLLAHALTGDWQKIAIIDTEQNSASYYSHLGPYSTVQIGNPFMPERFIEAIELCELSDMEVIILDSMSPEWTGELGIKHQYCICEGNKAQKWAEVMPLHQMFMNTILSSPCHVIATVRTNGSKVEQDKSYSHHFTTVIELKEDRKLRVVKDRSGVFKGITALTGIEEKGLELSKWCQQGITPVPEADVMQMKASISIEQLNGIKEFDLDDVGMNQAFIKRRLQIEATASHL